MKATPDHRSTYVEGEAFAAHGAVQLVRARRNPARFAARVLLICLKYIAAERRELSPASAAVYVLDRSARGYSCIFKTRIRRLFTNVPGQCSSKSEIITESLYQSRTLHSFIVCDYFMHVVK